MMSAEQIYEFLRVGYANQNLVHDFWQDLTPEDRIAWDNVAECVNETLEASIRHAHAGTQTVGQAATGREVKKPDRRASKRRADNTDRRARKRRVDDKRRAALRKPGA